MELDINIVFQFLLSLGIGALIGMERGVKEQGKLEKSEFRNFGEIRTFSLISFLGALSAFIGKELHSVLFISILFFLIGTFVLSYYIYGVFREKKFGLTTEFSVLATFLLGVFVVIGYAHLAIVLSILLTFLLSSKFSLNKITNKISEIELINTLKFAIISIVILPLLPDVKYSLLDIFQFLGFSGKLNSSFLTVKFFSPYGVWFFVVLMSGISYIGYLMSKIIGEKGSILASGAIGGLISSTAVTASMTDRSNKDKKNIDMYVVSTLIASTIMFVRVIIIVLFFNINLLPNLIAPSLLMFFGMLIYVYYFYRKGKLNPNKTIDDSEKFESPFTVGPAFKFALFVLFIKFVSAVGGVYKDVWGDYFFYCLGIISGLADVDAISQTMAVSSLDSEISLNIAVTTIIIAIISNNLVKGGIAFRFGEKRFGISVLLGFIFSMMMGIFGIILIGII